MNQPLVSADWLAARLDDPRLCLLDASVELAAPEFDGDYRVESGHAGWLAGHIRGARHADLLSDLADPQASFSFALPDPQREVLFGFYRVSLLTLAISTVPSRCKD
ncbi:MAG: hypothetical protein QM805_29150, partial [Pseudomonas sp.]